MTPYLIAPLKRLLSEREIARRKRRYARQKARRDATNRYRVRPATSWL